jgi:hypothetical protein
MPVRVVAVEVRHQGHVRGLAGRHQGPRPCCRIPPTPPARGGGAAVSTVRRINCSVWSKPCSLRSHSARKLPSGSLGSSINSPPARLAGMPSLKVSTCPGNSRRCAAMKVSLHASRLGVAMAKRSGMAANVAAACARPRPFIPGWPAGTNCRSAASMRNRPSAAAPCGPTAASATLPRGTFRRAYQLRCDHLQEKQMAPVLRIQRYLRPQRPAGDAVGGQVFLQAAQLALAREQQVDAIVREGGPCQPRGQRLQHVAEQHAAGGDEVAVVQQVREAHVLQLHAFRQLHGLQLIAFEVVAAVETKGMARARFQVGQLFAQLQRIGPFVVSVAPGHIAATGLTEQAPTGWRGRWPCR